VGYAVDTGSATVIRARAESKPRRSGRGRAVFPAGGRVQTKAAQPARYSASA